MNRKDSLRNTPTSVDLDLESLAQGLPDEFLKRVDELLAKMNTPEFEQSVKSLLTASTEELNRSHRFPDED